MDELRNKNGITLITLVVTIIVVLILAGITINLTVGEHGILKMAEKAGKDYKNASSYEKNELNKLYSEMTNGNKIEDPNPKPSISVGADTHKAQEIQYTWKELDKLAKVISDNYGEETGKINNNTEEVKINIDGKEYTLGIGDYKTLNTKEVRIIGFNHDTLSNENAYGGTNTYAGISFEFTECLTTVQMNSERTNSGGWIASTLRGTLNSTTLDSLENKEYIKEVSKQYIAIYNQEGSVTTSNDKLWLLSCSEIWNNGYTTEVAYGSAVAKEGEQYKYYKKINPISSNKSPMLVKQNYSDTSNTWWLRSPCYNKDTYYCFVNPYGLCSSFYADNSYGLAPSFSI